MPMELHFAEDALALHLSLQCLEGLVDIVVTDENLHVKLLFDQSAPDSRAARATGIYADGTHRTNQVRLAKSLPIGTTAANWKKRGLRHVAAGLRARTCIQEACRGKEQ